MNGTERLEVEIVSTKRKEERKGGGGIRRSVLLLLDSPQAGKMSNPL